MRIQSFARAGIIASIATVLLAGASYGQEADEDHAKRRLIMVSGDSEVFVSPDRAVLRLGAEVQGETAEEAQGAVNEIMARAIKNIRKSGIEERAIRTSTLHLSPVYHQPEPRQNREQAPPKIAGYRASNTLQITVEELDQLGEVIDTGVKAGVNQIQGVSFGLKDDLNARLQALRAAVRESRQKAEIIADSAGVKLGPIHQINESGARVIPPQPMMMAAFERAASFAATPVQPGEIQVQANVSVAYEIAE